MFPMMTGNSYFFAIYCELPFCRVFRAQPPLNLVYPWIGASRPLTTVLMLYPAPISALSRYLNGSTESDKNKDVASENGAPEQCCNSRSDFGASL